MASCYYYDEQHNRCKCYVNENLNELLGENAKLRELVLRAHGCKINEGCCEDCWDEYGDCPIEADMRVLGIEESNE